VVDGFGVLYCVSLDGALRWQFRIDSPVFGAAACGIRGNTVIGDAEGRIYNFAPDGKLYWKRALGDSAFMVNALIDSIGNIYVVSGSIETSSSGLYKFFPDGSLDWSVPLNDICFTAPLIDNGNRILLIDDSGELYTFFSDGSPGFSTMLPDGSPLMCGALMSGSNLVVPTKVPDLRVLPFGIGVPSLHVTGDDIACGAAVNTMGEVVILLHDGSATEGCQLRLLDSGLAQIWNTPLGGSAFGRIAVDSLDRVFVCTVDSAEPFTGTNRIFCVSRDQEIEWFYDVGERYAAFPAVVGEGLLAMPTNGPNFSADKSLKLLMIGTLPD
jgi:outer membrane protein assembly factor BamB